GDGAQRAHLVARTVRDHRGTDPQRPRARPRPGRPARALERSRRHQRDDRDRRRVAAEPIERGATGSQRRAAARAEPSARPAARRVRRGDVRRAATVHLRSAPGGGVVGLPSREGGVIMTKLRWGVLGVAKIATNQVIPGTRTSPGSEVVAIASRDLARARAAADELDIPRAHGSYEALLEDPDVDAVYVPLPNHLHVPWSIRALEAGKHVLCEKPIAM